MESQTIFASKSAPFTNLSMRKMNKDLKIMATSTDNHKPVIDTTTTKEKVSVDNKAFEPKYINGFVREPVDTRKETLQVEKLNVEGGVKQEKLSVPSEEKFTEFNETLNLGGNLGGGDEDLMKEEEMINKNEEEKLKKKQHHLRKEQEEGNGVKGGKSGEKGGKSGEQGVDEGDYKNYITKEVKKLTKKFFGSETTTSTKTEENISFVTDLLMNIPQGPERENFKTTAAEIAFVLNLSDNNTPQKLWSLVGVEKGNYPLQQQVETIITQGNYSSIYGVQKKKIIINLRRHLNDSLVLWVKQVGHLFTILWKNNLKLKKCAKRRKKQKRQWNQTLNYLML
uniref:Uncharacterized protein n=1 Tax=Meloidogyne incognita TaxID=6306 RepID=A0A914LQ62_MELIC